MAAKLSLLPRETLEEAAECLKLMGHPARIRMVDILMQGEFQVNEIAEMCELQPHQASEHLRLLKGHGLLDSRRDGRAVYYSVADPRLPGLIQCIRKNCDAVERRTV
ncbi:MAG: metalloregulator ArsR/SmtB family transcription factor [Candidatus Brocadiia bacterium]